MAATAVAGTLLAWSMGSAVASTTTTPLRVLAQQQTNLLLKYYEGQNVSPSRCGQGQGSDGVDGVFLLPVLSFSPGDQSLSCTTSVRSVLVDLGGAVITEDHRFPQSSYPLNGQDVPFTPENLAPICDDALAQGYIAGPMPATLDGGSSITAPALDSGVFTARVSRHAVVPGGVDLYADSVSLGHPGQLATVFCGFKSLVSLTPGFHTIVVDYSALFGGTSTVFTFRITVKS